jgi:hypothetical protein
VAFNPDMARRTRMPAEAIHRRTNQCARKLSILRAENLIFGGQSGRNSSRPSHIENGWKRRNNSLTTSNSVDRLQRLGYELCRRKLDGSIGNFV